jgi:ankyrin repeat protein
MPQVWLLVLAVLATPARRASSQDRELIAAARRGDAARVTALVRAGADINAATPSGATALIEAARRGQLDVAQVLITAGADVDSRHRELGTALDAAERAGQTEMIALLRAHGARGSGKSVGDTVCVERWGGSGFCGVVQSRRENRFSLRVARVEGCAAGCAPDEECSAGRPVGGEAAEALRAGAEVEVPSWCLTRTAVSPRP